MSRTRSRTSGRAFNWHVLTINGHDYTQIAAALAEARATKGKPTFIVAQTIKGKGVSFMESQIGWHGVAPTEAQRRRPCASARVEVSVRAAPEA